MNWIRGRFYNWFQRYVMKCVRVGGWCGLCGTSVNELFPSDWSYGICSDCLDEYDGHEEMIDMSKIEPPEDVI